MSIYVYVAVMAVTTYLIRAIPLTLMKKPIRSRFLRSFLHYVPTACLTAMTFPDNVRSIGRDAGSCQLMSKILLFCNNRDDFSIGYFS